MKPFFKHPSNVCMTYIQHMKLSLHFAAILGIGSVQAVIHAFIPDICITSTTDVSKKINHMLKTNGC